VGVCFIISKNKQEMALTHPCYSDSAHFRIFRIHLPVAQRCNIKCKYCDRKIGLNYHAMRPGVSNRIITPEEAITQVDTFLKNKPHQKVVVGIAGPGDPLYNEATFQTLKLLYDKYPEIKLCLCTNGLLLEKSAERLFNLGLSYITTTINAVSPIIGKNIYEWIDLDEKKYYGFEAAKILIERQLAGMKKCVNIGMMTKVNSVLIPNINHFHLVEVTKKIHELGVYIHNIMPLIPLSDLSHISPPTCDLLREVRKQSERVMPLFRLCKQCRADACSIPGFDSPMYLCKS
jgi:nitrogen fixation protein NifB